MKHILSLSAILALFSVTQSNGGTFTNLVVSNIENQRVAKSLTIGANQSLRIVNRVCTPGYDGVIELCAIVDGVRVCQSFHSFDTLYGPLTFELAVALGGNPSGTAVGFVTLELTGEAPTTSTNTGGLSIPSNAVVIPADSAGPVNIILESSVDMITWNAALPGLYGTSTTNRFFRVRAIRN